MTRDGTSGRRRIHHSGNRLSPGGGTGTDGGNEIVKGDGGYQREESVSRECLHDYIEPRAFNVIIYTAREARARARATGIGRAPLLPLCARAFKTRRPFHLSTNLTEATGAERSER